jgi:SM-20-related protein
MINLDLLRKGVLQSEPYSWGSIGGLYSAKDADVLASTYPHDHYKTVTGNDGEKEYYYEARSLIAMGVDSISYPQELSSAWKTLADTLLSRDYRNAMSELVGIDLTPASLEVNIFHYTPGASLGPHLDLKTKIVTHVLYFNKTWDINDGGCLTILNSKDPKDVAYTILPVVGNSAIIVRSGKSWHAVSPVASTCEWSRRSVTITFYHPDSPSTMWPEGETHALHSNSSPDM